MGNKKALQIATKELNKAKAPSKPKDIIYDPAGQWKFPGQNTRIPSGDITMQGVPYPVYGEPNVGQPQMMYPGQDYAFPGADYVDEYPQMRRGGGIPKYLKLPKNYGRRQYSNNISATNRLFAKNFLFRKEKNKIYDPNAKYAEGGESGCPEGYAFNPRTGECIEWNPDIRESYDQATSFDPVGDVIYMNPNDRPEGMSDEEYAQMYNDQVEHEQLHRLQWKNDELKGESKTPLRMPSTVDNEDFGGDHYYNRRGEEVNYLHDYWKNHHPDEAAFIPDDVIYNYETDPAMYQLPWTVEGEARGYEYATHDGMESLFPKRAYGGVPQYAPGGSAGCKPGYYWNGAECIKISESKNLPTYADSLALYKNAIAKGNFYKSKNYTNTGKYSGFADPKVRQDAIKKLKEKLRQNPKWGAGNEEQAIMFGTGSKYIGNQPFKAKVKGTNLSQFGDVLGTIPDYIYNPAAPPILLHPEIAPQTAVIYEHKAGDISYIPEYNPLAIKPAKLLSDNEIKTRFKKYGASGIPESRLIRLGLVTEPTKLKQSLPPKPVKKSIPDQVVKPVVKQELPVVPIKENIVIDKLPIKPAYIDRPKKDIIDNSNPVPPKISVKTEPEYSPEYGEEGGPDSVGYHYKDRQKRYIDWNGRAVGYRPLKFRKPGHSGELIKLGGKKYFYLPTIESRTEGWFEADNDNEEEYQDGGQYRTKLTPEEEFDFQSFYRTLPDNLQTDDDTYDIRGYWDSEGRPEAFNYDQPKEDDGYYHAYSINQNTGEYLKSPAHDTFQHAVDEDRKIGYRPIPNVQGRNIATYNESIADPEEQSFLRNTEGPANYIETELTDDEIQAYRDGGYIVEDVSIPSLNQYQDGGENDYYKVKGSKGVYRKVNGKWEVDWNKTGNFQPLSKGDVNKRSKQLNKNAEPLLDPDYNTLTRKENFKYEAAPKIQPKKKLTESESKAQNILTKDFKVSGRDRLGKVEDKIEKDVADYIKYHNENFDRPLTQGDIDTAREIATNNIMASEGVYNPVWGDFVTNRKNISTADAKNFVAFDERPKNLTAGDYIDKGWDVLSNPLDYASYFLKPKGTVNTPWNMHEYEKRLEKVGAEDPVTNNLVSEGMDFVSWFHPAGAMAQSFKMIPDTAESIGTAIEDPTLLNLGKAAFDTGITALGVIPGSKYLKNAGKFLAEERPLRNAYLYNPLANRTVPMNKLFHGSDNPNLLLDDIKFVEPNPNVGSRPGQFKRRAIESGDPLEMPGGFYTNDRSVSGFMGNNNYRYSMDVPANAKVFKWETGPSDNISVKRLQELKNEGYDIIQGKNIIGEIEYIPLKKDLISNWKLHQKGDPELKLLKDLKFKTEQPHWLRGYPKSKSIISKSDSEDLAKILDLDPSNPMKKQYETISKTIEDVRADKVHKWQTSEGKKRLQNMIDNTPALKENGVTPESYVEGLVGMDNLNKNYLEQLIDLDKTNEAMLQLDKQYDLGYIDRTEWFNQSAKLENEVVNKRNAIFDTRNEINKYGPYNAYMRGENPRPLDLEKSFQSAIVGYDKNGMPILDFTKFKRNTGPAELFKIAVGEKNDPSYLKQLIQHELGHLLQKGEQTNLDKALSKLDLKPNDLFAETTNYSVTAGSQGWKKFKESPEYFARSKKYFTKGSKGKEKVPFAAEVRQDLLDRGIIKNEYDNITPSMLEKHYKTYLNKGGDKDLPLRLYDIMHGTKSNFKILSDVLNKLPVAIPVAIGAAALQQEKDGGIVSELSQKEIQDLIAQGYIVEDVD